MTLDEKLNDIKAEFMRELEKREDLLDRIAALQDANDQLLRDLAAYQDIYLMKNEICKRCMFADECVDANRVEGKRLCTSFHAQID